MQFLVTVDLSDFRRSAGQTIDELELGIGRAAENAAREGAEEAQRVGTYKDRTGQLRGTIRAELQVRSPRVATWAVVAPQPYARFVEGGTRPHRIVARAGKMLRWVDSSGVHYARAVNHPGTRPYPFMGPGYLKAERVLWRDLELLMVRVGKHWSGG